MQRQMRERERDDCNAERIYGSRCISGQILVKDAAYVGQKAGDTRVDIGIALGTGGAAVGHNADQLLLGARHNKRTTRVTLSKCAAS